MAGIGLLGLELELGLGLGPGFSITVSRVIRVRLGLVLGLALGLGVRVSESCQSATVVSQGSCWGWRAIGKNVTVNTFKMDGSNM